MAYDAGEAFISIIPSFRGVVERIDSEAARWGVSGGRKFSDAFNRTVRDSTDGVKLGPSDGAAARQGEKAGRAFADSFRARVDAALRALPDIKINADSTAAEVRIARLRTNLEQLRDQRIGVDIDTATALASVENIQRQLNELRAESPDVAVQVDTMHASEEIARIKAELDTLHDKDVDVDVDDHGTAEETARGVNALAIALIGLAPLAAPIGAALVAGFAGALSVVGVLGAAIGTVALGAGQVPKATQLLGQRKLARQQTGKTSSANAVAVQGAQQSLADAQRQAARQRVADALAVQHAEQQLGQTEQAVTQAQNALNAAREQARRDLIDLQNAATDANLSEQQARIDLANAQEHQRAVDADWTKTARDRRQAALDVAKAHQALTEAEIKNRRSTEDNNKAQKAGVAGQPVMVQAQKQLANAVQQQRAAVEALRAAQVKQRQDAADGARAITRAQQAVSVAMQRTGSVGINSLSGINSQLDKMPPAVVQFAKFWRSFMTPVLNDLRGQAASGLLPGIERGLRIMQPLFAPLGRFLHTIGGVMGTLFEQMAKAFTGPTWQHFFAMFSKEAPVWLMQFGHIMGNTITGIVGLLQDFAPITTMIGRGLEGATGKFAKWAENLGKSKTFQSFLEYIKQNGPLLMHALGQFIMLVVNLLHALAPLGHVLLVVIDAVESFLNTLSPDELLLIAAAIGAVIAAFGGPWWAIATVIVAVVGIIVRHWNDIVGFFKRTWADIAGFFTSGWHKITGAFHDAISWVENFFKAHWKLIILTVLTGPFALVIDWLYHKFWGPVKNAFTDAWQWVKTTFSSAWHTVKDILEAPLNAFLNTVHTIWDKLKSAFEAGMADVKTAVRSAWSAIQKYFESPVYFVLRYAYQDGIRALWDATAAKIGLPKLPDLSGFLDHLQHFAEGGVAPGYAPGRDVVPALLSPGEGILRPEVVRELGPDTIHRWNRNRSVQRFAGGGIVGDLGSFGHGIGSVLSSLNPMHLWDWVKDHWNSLSGLVSRLSSKVGNSAWAQALIKVPAQLISKIPGYLKDKIESWVLNTVGHVGANIGGDVTGALGLGSVHYGGTGTLTGVQHGLLGVIGTGPAAVWRALKLAGLPDIPAAGVMGNIQSESGFDPYVIQGGGDSLNPAAAGAGGYGLVQWTPGAKVIPYLRGMLPAVGTEIAALMAQLSGRGPSPESAAGRVLMGARTPYDAGVNFGLAYERYRGPVQTDRGTQADYWFRRFGHYDQGGLLPPGPSLVYNGTGQAELVAPAQTFEQLMSGRSGGSVSGELHLSRTSQDELGAWVDVRIDDRAGFDGAIGRAGG